VSEGQPDIVDAPARKIKKERKIPLSTVVFVILLVAVVSFIGGTRSRSVISLISGSSASLDLTSLNDLYSILAAKYDGKLDSEALLEGAKHGLVDAVGDPYTVFLNASEARALDDDLNGTFEGIGAELSKINGVLTVTGLVGDSPAQQAGLLVDDQIAKVNDEETASLTVGQAVQKIRGEKGTTVKLTILRGETTKEVSIVRNTITSESVQWEVLDGSVGYMRITRFSDDTARLSRKAAEELTQKGVKSILLDLRGNGGGLLTAAQDVSSLWLNNKVVVTERRGGQVTNTLRSGTNPVLEGMKTVVLVDGGSASASEIVAGALRDNDAATLVGTTTYGKGSVQAILSLGDGSQLKVTIARWHTPSGQNINQEGIAPDVKVERTEADTSAGKDTQKDTALQQLR
jgi:carboxyl-terminal processing protease